MEVLVFTLCLSSAFGLKEPNLMLDHIDFDEYRVNPEAKIVEKGHNCVDISHFKDVEYNVTETTLCAFKQRTHCEPKRSEVCRDIPVTRCEIVGYTECVEHPHTHQVREDKLENEKFYRQECSQVQKIVKEIKKAPHCEMVTKERCDSRWVVDEQGEKKFETSEDCRNVTWEDCRLVDKEVEREISSFECQPTDEPFVFKNVVHDTEEVTTVDRVCEPRVEKICEVKTEEQCETVEWEECRDTVQPHCFGFQIRIPHQEFNHLLRCIEH